MMSQKLGCPEEGRTARITIRAQQLGQQTEAGSGQRLDHGSVGVMVAPGAEIYVGPGGWADLADGAGISWFGPVHGDLRAGYRDVGGG